MEKIWKVPVNSIPWNLVMIMIYIYIIQNSFKVFKECMSVIFCETNGGQSVNDICAISLGCWFRVSMSKNLQVSLSLNLNIPNENVKKCEQQN